MEDNIISNTPFLYKYRELNKTNEDFIKEIFCKNRLYFPSPLAFNDPFDCRVGIVFDGTKKDWIKYSHKTLKDNHPELNRAQRESKIQARLKQGSIKQQAQQTLEIQLKKIGVFCLSEKKDDLLMWSHYSGGHTGFCLEFKIIPNDPFFARAETVRYPLEYPQVNFFKASKVDIVFTLLLTKALCWKYERERRIIKIIEGPGKYTFPEELLTGVIFGDQMPEDNKQLIREWIKGRKSPPILYQAKRKEKEFGLDIFKI